MRRPFTPRRRPDRRSAFVQVGTETRRRAGRADAELTRRLAQDLAEHGELPHAMTFKVADLDAVEQHLGAVGIGVAERSDDIDRGRPCRSVQRRRGLHHPAAARRPSPVVAPRVGADSRSSRAICIQRRACASAISTTTRLDPEGLPVVFVPGITDFADEYEAIGELFGSRRLLVIEMRGRGGSDAPLTGYSVSEQASDVEAVIAANGLERFHLMTFSAGHHAGLEVALRRPPGPSPCRSATIWPWRSP